MSKQLYSLCFLSIALYLFLNVTVQANGVDGDLSLKYTQVGAPILKFYYW